LSAAAGGAPRAGIHRFLFLLLVLIALFTSAVGVANVLLAAALIVWTTVLTRERRWSAAFRSWIVFWVGIFLACTAVSAVVSLHPDRSLVALKGSFTFLLLPLFADGMENERHLRGILTALGAAAATLAGVGLWQYLHGANRLSERIAATLSHYMTFSGLLLVVCLLFVGIAIEGRQGRLASAILVLLLGAAILLTFTRNAYVGFFAALIMYLAIRRPAWLLVVPALAGGLYLASPPAIRARLISTFDPSDPTNRDRLDMAVAGFRMIRDYPVFGIGLTLIKPYYPLYRVPTSVRWRVPHLHDNLLQIAAESGLVAAAAYVAILACFFIACLRALRREGDRGRRGILAGAFLAVAGISVAGFFEYNFGDVEVLMTTLIVMAIPFSRPFRNAEASSGRDDARHPASRAAVPEPEARRDLVGNAGAAHE
jgi:O-antigen ligase